MTYLPRLADGQLDALLKILPAVAIEGAKGVGKTATASTRARSSFRLDDPGTFTMVAANPELVLTGERTTLIDEWQRVPSTWDLVRRAVDDGAAVGSFLLAGSAAPNPKARPHSGAGRIVRLMMRPMSLPERGIDTPTVSLASLLRGGMPNVAGHTALSVIDYTREILASGFPGIRAAQPAAQSLLLDSYVEQIVDQDIPEAGQQVRRPASLLHWLTAYAAATATTASYASLLAAATPGETEKPSKVTAISYRDLLQRIWVLEPLPAWSPTLGNLRKLGQAPKHHLVDPALAAVLVGATESALLGGEGPKPHGEGVFLGALFESLAVQTVRCLCGVDGAKAYHLRTQGGDHEIDIIVQRRDLKIVAIEVKLSSIVRPADVAQLTWLRNQMPDLVLDTVLLNTGPAAYRRADGVAVVPLALLGP